VEPPDGVAGTSVEREGRPRAAHHPPQVPLKEPAVGREVDKTVHDARRARDPPGCVEAPAEVAGARIDRREVPVPRSDEHHVPPDRGCRVDVGPRLASPEQMPGGRPVCVDGSVRVADEDASVGNRRGSVEILPPAKARKRLRVPALSPGARTERVDTAAVRAHVDGPVRVRRGTNDLVVGLVAPEHAMSLLAHVERIDPAIPRAEVEDVADEQRCGLDRAGPEAPFGVARLGVERHDHPARSWSVLLARPAMHQREIDGPVRHRGGAGYAIWEVPAPDDSPQPRVDGEHRSAAIGEEDAAVGDDRRSLEGALRLDGPEARVRRPNVERRGASALGVVAVHRPGLREQLLERSLLRLLGGNELRRRRPAHRAIPLLMPGPPAEGGARP
jgi:hypothetical protein